MTSIDYKIILPTNVKYFDITRNFIELLKLNWPEAYKHLIISVTGQKNNKLSIDDIPIIFNDPQSSLPTCIYNAAQNNKADYYLSFLGDAFIYKSINNEKIEALLSLLINKSINYCRLVPQASLYKKSENNYYRMINSNERYSHSFVAFGANFDFIKKEFKKKITDRQFELKYLELASKKENSYYTDRVILKRNFFHILPSIQKGKWDRINIYYLKKKYPQIEFSNRELINWEYESILQIRKILLPITPDCLRLKAKNKSKKYFDTNL